MGGWGATQASGKKGIRLMVTGEEQVWQGPPAHHGSHLGKPVPDHLETARPPITVARTCYPDPFLVFATHAQSCLLKRTTTPPCPSATAPPCCLSVAQAPSSSARPHLWLLTARSGWQQQRPDARTCSEKGQAGGQVRCGRTYWSIGRTQRSSLQSRLSPTALPCIPAYCLPFLSTLNKTFASRDFCCEPISLKFSAANTSADPRHEKGLNYGWHLLAIFLWLHFLNQMTIWG